MRTLALRASFWTIGGYSGSLVLRLGSNLVLAHLVDPEVFGLMVLIQTLLQGLAMFSDIGLGPSIVRDEKGEDPRFLNTAWTVQIIRGVVLTGIAMALAAPYAMFYEHPELVVLVLVAALNPLISGFNSTKVFTHTRNLDVRTPTLLQLVTQTVSAAVMIGWAWFHPTVWALLVGGLVAAVMRMVFSHTVLKGVPNRLAWDREMRGRLFSFGKWILVGTILTFLASQGDRLLFGKLVSLEALGVYSIAVILAGVATQLVLQLGSAVVFPVYSAMLNQGKDIRPMFARVREPLLLGAGFVVACLMAGGEPLVRVLYPASFEGAGWMLQFLAAGGWFQVMGVSMGSALLAMGHSKATAVGNLAKLIGIGVLVPAGWVLGEFPGALIGLVLADGAKYAALAVVSRQRGLHGMRQEVVLTVAVAVTGGAGMLLAGELTAIGWTDMAIGAVVGMLASVIWGTVAAVRLRRKVAAGVTRPMVEAV